MWLPGRHCRMFSALASLLVVFVILRLVAAAVSRFFAWLGSGRMLEEAVDDPNEQYAQAIRTYVDQLRRWKREHTGIGAVAKGRPRLTRAQRHYIVDTTARARDAYLDYLRLGWYQVVIIFLLASTAGLVLEEVWMFVTAGLTQSRPGLVWGPFSPLYGCGAVLLTLFCWGMRKVRANDGVVFLVSAAVGGGLEQVTGWAMETLFHASSWTYIHLPDHITQWVAWRFLFFWGVIGLVWARYVMPDLLYRIGAPTFKRQAVFVLLLAAYLGLDIFMTIACFTRKTLRDEGVPAATPFQEWVDENYTDQFIAARFQNLVIKSPNGNSINAGETKPAATPATDTPSATTEKDAS